MSPRFRAGLFAALPLLVLAACGDEDTNAVTGPGQQPGFVKVVQAIGLGAGTPPAAVPATALSLDQAAPFATNVAVGAVSPSPNFQYHGVSAGNRQIRLVEDANRSTVIATGTVAVESGLFYTLVAAGSRAATSGALAPAFIVLRDSVGSGADELPPADRIRVRAVHAASSVGAVDVHVQAAANAAALALSATTRLFTAVPFRGSGSALVPFAPAGASYFACVIPTGTTPTANGSNCAILGSITPANANGLVNAAGNRGRAQLTVIARDPIAPATAPGLIFTTDKPVQP